MTTRKTRPMLLKGGVGMEAWIIRDCNPDKSLVPIVGHAPARYTISRRRPPTPLRDEIITRNGDRVPIGLAEWDIDGVDILHRFMPFDWHSDGGFELPLGGIAKVRITVKSAKGDVPYKKRTIWQRRLWLGRDVMGNDEYPNPQYILTETTPTLIGGKWFDEDDCVNKLSFAFCVDGWEQETGMPPLLPGGLTQVDISIKEIKS